MCWDHQLRADGVSSLLWWQRDTYWAANTQQVFCSPSRYASFSWSGRVVNVGWICCILYLYIWSTLLGSAVLFPSDSGHSVNTISAPGAAMFVCVCPSLSSACVRWNCIWSTCFSVSYLKLWTDTLPYCTLSLGTDSIAFYSVVEFGFANEWCVALFDLCSDLIGSDVVIQSISRC